MPVLPALRRRPGRRARRRGPVRAAAGAAAAAAALLLALALPACDRGPAGPDLPPGRDEAALAAPAATDSFLVRTPAADAVYLAGSVNDWASADPAYAFALDPDGLTWRLGLDLPAGLTTYKFVLHAGGELTWLTDPRALEVLPDGIHGSPAMWNAVRGRVVAAPRPLPQPLDRTRLVIYEVSLNDLSAGGSFVGAIGALTSGADLVDLGVNAVELMPVTAPAYNGWGYDPVLYFAPNPSFGYPSHLAALVDQCHANGIAVILDMVLNHAAGDCVLRQLDDFAGERRYTTDEPNAWGLVELNWTQDALRSHILAACLHWIETYGVDGFRLDYVGGEPYSTWVWLRSQLLARHPDLLMIAEDFRYPAEGNSVTNGYDAQWGGNHTDAWGGGGNNFDQVMVTALTERGFAWRGETVPTVGAFGTEYRNMWAVANVVSGNSQYAGPVPGDGFSDVKYLESHDENRLVWAVDTYGAAGAQAVGGLRKAHLGAVVLMTSVGIPMLYNGQEIGADEYRPQIPTIQKIDWTAGDADLRSAYKHLIRLRLTHPALGTENVFFQWRDGIVDQEERTVVYWRGPTGTAANASLVVAANFDHLDHGLTVPFPAPGPWYRMHPVTGAVQLVDVPAGGLPVTLPASEARLWLRADGLTGVPR